MDRIAASCVRWGMSPNLSFERLAIVLALTGCSKATPAADGANSTVRSDPSAAVQAEKQGEAPPPPTATAMATTVATAASASASPAPGGPAGAMELRKHKNIGGGGGTTGQASCGAGSCTSEIKKK